MIVQQPQPQIQQPQIQQPQIQQPQIQQPQIVYVQGPPPTQPAPQPQQIVTAPNGHQV